MFAIFSVAYYLFFGICSCKLSVLRERFLPGLCNEMPFCWILPKFLLGGDFCSWLVLYRMYSAVDHFISLYLWLEVADLSWGALVTWPPSSQSHCLVQRPLLPAFWGSHQQAVPVKGLLQEVMLVLGKSQPVHSGIDNQSHSLTEAHQPYDEADCFPLAEQEGINYRLCQSCLLLPVFMPSLVSPQAVQLFMEQSAATWRLAIYPKCK